MGIPAEPVNANSTQSIDVRADIVFYDDACRLCRAAARTIDRKDHGSCAPLDGDLFTRLVPPERRTGLPDSLVVRTRDGALLTRSEAILHLLSRLGAGNRLLAQLGRRLPRSWRDQIYDIVARARRRVPWLRVNP